MITRSYSKLIKYCRWVCDDGGEEEARQREVVMECKHRLLAYLSYITETLKSNLDTLFGALGQRCVLRLRRRWEQCAFVAFNWCSYPQWLTVHSGPHSRTLQWDEEHIWAFICDLLVKGQTVKPQSGLFLPYKGPEEDGFLHLKHLADALLCLFGLMRKWADWIMCLAKASSLVKLFMFIWRIKLVAWGFLWNCKRFYFIASNSCQT